MKTMSTPVVLLRQDGTRSERVLTYSIDPCTISLDVLERSEPLRFEGDDLFICLQALRRELEKRRVMICCNGSRRDCWPSAMSRQMGGARTVYIHRIGEPGSDLVDLFARAEPELLATVDEQAEFHRRWVRSLG